MEKKHYYKVCSYEGLVIKYYTEEQAKAFTEHTGYKCELIEHGVQSVKALGLHRHDFAGVLIETDHQSRERTSNFLCENCSGCKEYHECTFSTNNYIKWCCMYIRCMEEKNKFA